MFLSKDVNTQVTTLALVPQIVAAVKIPVIAAGGIADASGVAAVMALGAAGVQIGTAYLLCPETSTSALHRAALQSDAARVTALTNLFTGRLARGIVNRVMRELGSINNAAPEFPSPRPPSPRCEQPLSESTQRFFAAVGRSECDGVQGDPGRQTDAGTRGTGYTEVGTRNPERKNLPCPPWKFFPTAGEIRCPRQASAIGSAPDPHSYI